MKIIAIISVSIFLVVNIIRIIYGIKHDKCVWDIK